MRTHSDGKRAPRIAITAVALALAGLLAGCGGASNGAVGGASTASHNATSNSYGPMAGGAGASSTGTSSQSSDQQPAAQYLIKSLAVSLTATDPRKSASEIQTWILTTDPKAQSAGVTYNQDGSSYDVSMTFNVEAAIYPQVESYLAAYAQGHGGALVNLQETVQDVTNDYVDSQSRLTNLRGEQQRLLALMGQAQSLSDVLTIEQRLTDVEGQIEQIEAHLAQLAGQTTFYAVRVALSPLDTAVATPSESWNPGKIFHDALNAAIGFGQGLLTLLIWLGVFALYIAPAMALIWFGRRLVVRRRAGPATTPPSA